MEQDCWILGMFIVNLVKDLVSALFGLVPEGVAFGSLSPEEKTVECTSRGSPYIVLKESQSFATGQPAPADPSPLKKV
jgi:hypothetical protein